MKSVITSLLFLFTLIALCGLAGCISTNNPYKEPLPVGFPYYGFLEGDDFKIYESQKELNFFGKAIALDLKDSRMGKVKAQCVDFELDRNTELEGNRGMALVSEYFGSSLQNANAKIDLKADRKLKVEVEGLSFKLDGFGQITVHGIVQMKVNLDKFEKTYCVDLTDKSGDSYSPLKWYSFDTRVGASRKMVSGVVRKAVDQILSDIQL